MFPIGIDSKKFERDLLKSDVQKHMKELKERFKGRKIMLGVDRLDMIKGKENIIINTTRAIINYLIL